MIIQAAKAEDADGVGMPYSNTDQENGFLKLLNVPLKQFQPLVRQCTEVGIFQKLYLVNFYQISPIFRFGFGIPELYLQMKVILKT